LPTFEDRPAAKVNLTLQVVRRRPDGYHDLRSTFLRVGLTDRLTFTPTGADSPDRLTVAGLPGAPTRGNLVMRALDAVRARIGLELPAIDLSLEKGIPVAAGLGGGSSDAASAIKLAGAFWGIGLSPAEELAVGAELGSDVPFFLSGAHVALVEGRGEQVTALPDVVGELGVLLVTPPQRLATADVFARYDDLGSQVPNAAIGSLATDRLVESADRLRDSNDLWLAAAWLLPSIAARRAELEDLTGRPWLMSGSGPTLFALYPSVEAAVTAGKALVSGQSAASPDTLISAVDLIGPDPAWRYP
jgi:4-diphosphocytidyl-2-C-methyl-D-erythritol kinase